MRKSMNSWEPAICDARWVDNDQKSNADRRDRECGLWGDLASNIFCVGVRDSVHEFLFLNVEGLCLGNAVQATAVATEHSKVAPH